MLLNKNIAEPTRLSRKEGRVKELGFDPIRVTRLVDTNDFHRRRIPLPHLRNRYFMGFFTEPGLVLLERLFKEYGPLGFHVFYNVAVWNWKETEGLPENDTPDDVLLENIFDV